LDFDETWHIGVSIVHTLSLSGACPLLRSCLVISVLINVYYLVYYLRTLP